MYFSKFASFIHIQGSINRSIRLKMQNRTKIKVSASECIKFSFIKCLPALCQMDRHFLSFSGTRLDFPESGSQDQRILFNAKNKEKVLKSRDFRTFMVAETGLEPATSGL